MEIDEKKRMAHREADKRYREKRLKENPFKKCAGCGEIKPLEEFAYSKGEHRYKSKCKSCRHEAYILDKEKALERANKYYQENREDVLKKSHKRRKANIAKEILRSARERSKKKGLEFNIDESDIVVPERCPVLDIPLIQGEGKPTKNSPSIDRINPNKGYIKGNVIIVSYLANTIKTNATVEEIKKVAEFYEKLENK